MESRCRRSAWASRILTLWPSFSSTAASQAIPKDGMTLATFRQRFSRLLTIQGGLINRMRIIGNHLDQGVFGVGWCSQIIQTRLHGENDGNTVINLPQPEKTWVCSDLDLWRVIMLPRLTSGWIGSFPLSPMSTNSFPPNFRLVIAYAMMDISYVLAC